MRAWVYSAVMAAAVVAATRTAAAAPFDRSGIADWTTPPPPGAEPVFTPPVPRRMRLANGISVLVIEKRGVPTVAMQLVVPGAGSAYDPSGKPGIAAFTADMLDEGTAGMTALQFAETAERLGATITTSIDADAAYVTVSTLTATLAQTVDLVANLLTRPTATDADFARVAGDRAASLELLRDRPTDLARQVERAALFGPDTPYGHPADGRHGSFGSITFADLRAFYAAQWTPGAMTLVVSGDVDASKLVARLNAGLGAWRPTSIRPLRPVRSPAVTAQRLQLVDRPGARQSDVRLGLVTIDHKNDRYAAYEVVANALCGGFTGRVTQRLREQLGIIYHAYSATDWQIGPGAYMMWTAIDTPETARGLAEMLRLVDEFATTPMPAGELDKTKQNLIRALPAAFATNAQTVSTIGQLALLGLPDDYYAHHAAAIRKVTTADIQAVGKDVIPASKIVITVVGDMSRIRASLDQLGLGGARVLDLHGMPVK